MKEVQKLKLCANCLHHEHTVNNCKYGTYKNCKSKYNTLLHEDRELEPLPETLSNALALTCNTPGQVLLSTALVEISQNGRKLIARVLLDCGLQLRKEPAQTTGFVKHKR